MGPQTPWTDVLVGKEEKHTIVKRSELMQVMRWHTDAVSVVYTRPGSPGPSCFIRLDIEIYIGMYVCRPLADITTCHNILFNLFNTKATNPAPKSIATPIMKRQDEPYGTPGVAALGTKVLGNLQFNDPASPSGAKRMASEPTDSRAASGSPGANLLGVISHA